MVNAHISITFAVINKNILICIKNSQLSRKSWNRVSINLNLNKILGPVFDGGISNLCIGYQLLEHWLFVTDVAPKKDCTRKHIVQLLNLFQEE